MIGRQGQLNGHGQPHDASRGVGAHVFLHANFHAADVEILSLRHNADDRGHARVTRASREPSGESIGAGADARREQRAIPPPIPGGIGPCAGMPRPLAKIEMNSSQSSAMEMAWRNFFARSRAAASA